MLLLLSLNRRYCVDLAPTPVARGAWGSRTGGALWLDARTLTANLMSGSRCNGNVTAAGMAENFGDLEATIGFNNVRNGAETTL
jgi:hypothetical protein